MFLSHWLAAGDVDGRAVEIARLLRGEEDEYGGKFGGLRRAAHRGLLPKLGDLSRRAWKPG